MLQISMGGGETWPPLTTTKLVKRHKTTRGGEEEGGGERKARDVIMILKHDKADDFFTARTFTVRIRLQIVAMCARQRTLSARKNVPTNNIPRYGGGAHHRCLTPATKKAQPLSRLTQFNHLPVNASCPTTQSLAPSSSDWVILNAPDARHVITNYTESTTTTTEKATSFQFGYYCIVLW